MVSRILAFRPASVVERLGPRSAACPLSLRELLGAAAAHGLVLPIVRAPIAGVARAALVAAKEHQSALGLALPAGLPPEPWFAAVTDAADEVAAGLPIFLSAEVTVEGEAAMEVERAFHEAWRLVDAGVTHLAIDAAALPPAERGRIVAELASAGIERGVCIDCVVPLREDGGPSASRAGATFEELARRGAPPDVVSVRCPEPADAAEAQEQLAALARICAAVGGAPVIRRGPVTPALLGRLAGSPVKACEDGGRAAARALASIPRELLPAAGQDARRNPLEQTAAELSRDAAERLEARAYVEVTELLEGLGAQGSAIAIARALERRLEER